MSSIGTGVSLLDRCMKPLNFKIMLCVPVRVASYAENLARGMLTVRNFSLFVSFVLRNSSA